MSVWLLNWSLLCNCKSKQFWTTTACVSVTKEKFCCGSFIVALLENLWVTAFILFFPLSFSIWTWELINRVMIWYASFYISRERSVCYILKVSFCSYPYVKIVVMTSLSKRWIEYCKALAKTARTQLKSSYFMKACCMSFQSSISEFN